ncbi:MAG: CopG family transcriptional regulator [Bacillota bacterium]
MSRINLRRATIYLDPDLHKALRIKAAATDQTISDLVNAAVRRSLAEDAVDLAAFEDRVHEPTVAFENVLRDLKRLGKL